MGPPLSPRERIVIPGAGGGTGTPGDPFLGLQAAADDAQPGDVFQVVLSQRYDLELGGEKREVSLMMA